MNKSFYDKFLNSTPLNEKEPGVYEKYRYNNIEIGVVKAEKVQFYKYLLSLNQRLCKYEDEQIQINEKNYDNMNIWDYLYEALDTSYGLCLSKSQTNGLQNPYDRFLERLGLKLRDFEAIRILLGVEKLNMGVASFYSDSYFIKDIIDHCIALCILRHIDLRNAKRKERTRNRRIKKCTATMVFNKIYTFNKKVLWESAIDSDNIEFPNVISSSIESDMNSLLLHKKMLLSDASFEVLEGKSYTDLKTLIAQSQKLYRNLLKKDVEGDYALNEKFLLEQLDEQICCLPITLLHKWLSNPNVSFEVKQLLSQNNDDIKGSLILFFLLLCNLPHYMSVSILKHFNEVPTHGLFSDSRSSDIELVKNIKLLNQVLLAFLFDVFPFIDRLIKSIITDARGESIEAYKVEAYGVLSDESYQRYQEELERLYNSTNEESYYDNDIIQKIDRLLPSQSLSISIWQKYGLDIVKRTREVPCVLASQEHNTDWLYNRINQCIKELFMFLYNEYRMHLHNENTYKSGHSVFIEEKEAQSNPQRIGWASKDTRWNKGENVKQVTDLIYDWIKCMYNVDSSYEWGRQEDERLIDLLRIQDDESALIRGLTKYRYHYKDILELSGIMKAVKKEITKFFKSIYAVLNCNDIECMPFKAFVLEDEYLKQHMEKSALDDTFDKLTFWLYLPYLNEKNIYEFLDSVVTCDKHNLRKSYLTLYDTLEQFLWSLSLYLEEGSVEKQSSSIRLKDVVLDKLICGPMSNRRLFNAAPVTPVVDDSEIYKPSKDGQ